MYQRGRTAAYASLPYSRCKRASCLNPQGSPQEASRSPSFHVAKSSTWPVCRHGPQNKNRYRFRLRRAAVPAATGRFIVEPLEPVKPKIRKNFRCRPTGQQKPVYAPCPGKARPRKTADFQCFSGLFPKEKKFSRFGALRSIRGAGPGYPEFFETRPLSCDTR